MLITLNSDDIKRRWQAAYEAKIVENERGKNVLLWLYEFERHLKEGESWDSAYRLPEELGYVNRRYNSMMDALPEAKFTGNGAIGMQAAADKFMSCSNVIREKQAVMAEAAAAGTGCLFLQPVEYIKHIRGEKEPKLMYKGLSGEAVPWRNIFPAPGARMFHDHTGQNFVPYLFRRKVYTYDSFLRLAKQAGYKNIDEIQPGAWEAYNVWGDNSFTTTHEHQETDGEGDGFVTVLEYWDQELDMFEIYGSGGVHLYSSPTGIPFSHKMLPFHAYRDTFRLDSINGIGEVEKSLPYNLFRERALNLGMKGAELSLQPSLVVDGDIDFNTEENELDMGAVFSTRGLAGGKLQDHIMPLVIPEGFSMNVQNLMKVLEDSRMSVMSDDPVSMYSRPDQLATQINAKTKNLNKDIDNAAKRNLYNTEYYLMMQVASFVKNEFSKSYKDGKKTVRASVKISGYSVVQNGDDGKVKFTREDGASSAFSLNENTAKDFKDTELEIVSAIRDDELKRDKTEKMMVMINNIMQTMASLAQFNPQLIPEIFGDMKVAEMLKVQAKALGLSNELTDIFPTVKKEGYQLDEITAEHEQILSGITPPIRSDEDSMRELDEHMEFSKSAFFKKNATKKAKESMTKHIILTMENVQKENQKPVETRQQEAAGRQRELSGGRFETPQGVDGQSPAGGGANSPQQEAGSPVG